MVSDAGRDVAPLAGRLHRAADRLLRAERGLSYRRFVALLMVGELGVDTTGELADRLGVPEPCASRLAGALAAAGLLATPARGGASLAVTPAGRRALEDCQALLGARLAALTWDAVAGAPDGAGRTNAELRKLAC